VFLFYFLCLINTILAGNELNIESAKYYCLLSEFNLGGARTNLGMTKHFVFKGVVKNNAFFVAKNLIIKDILISFV